MSSPLLPFCGPNDSVYQGKNAIASIFKEVQPRGRTPPFLPQTDQVLTWLSTGRTRTGAALQQLLDDHITKLDLAINTADYPTIRPLDIIVLTDGVPLAGT